MSKSRVDVSKCGDYGSNTEESTCFHGSEKTVGKRRNHPKMGNPEQGSNKRYSNEEVPISSLVLRPDRGRFARRGRGAREDDNRQEKFAGGREHMAVLTSQL
jgi:hypothetical protein